MTLGAMMGTEKLIVWLAETPATIFREPLLKVDENIGGLAGL